MIPHETIEIIPSRNSTLKVRGDRVISSRIDVPEPSGGTPPCACRSKAASGLPSVRKQPSGRSCRCAAGTAPTEVGVPRTRCRTVAWRKTAVKPMLRLEFSRFSMLRFLRVSHLAVIDAVEVEFDAGLNVLTGETGAGKSILVEAVGLLLGGRASGDLVRTGEEAAGIEAIFESAGE